MPSGAACLSLLNVLFISLDIFLHQLVKRVVQLAGGRIFVGHQIIHPFIMARLRSTARQSGSGRLRNCIQRNAELAKRFIHIIAHFGKTEKKILAELLFGWYSKGERILGH